MNLEEFLIRVYEVGLLLRKQRKPIFCPLELEEKYKLFYGEDLPLTDLGFTDFESLLLSQSEYFVRHDEVYFSCLLKEGYVWKYRIPRNPFARPKLVDLSDPLAPARSESTSSRSSSVSDVFGDYEDDLKPFHSISEPNDQAAPEDPVAVNDGEGMEMVAFLEEIVEKTEVQAVLDELMAVICDEERIQQKHEDLKVTDGKIVEAQEMAAVHQVIEGLLKKLEEEAAVLIRNEAEVRATLDEMLAAVCDEGKAAEENTCLIKMEENVDEMEEMAPQNMDQKLVDEHVTDTVQVLSLHNEVVGELKTELDKGPSLAPFSGSLADGDDFNGGGDSELVESISKAKNPSPPRKLSSHHDDEGTGREKTLYLEEEFLEKTRRRNRSKTRSRSPHRRRRHSRDSEERDAKRRSRSRSPKRRRLRERSEDSEERATRRRSRSRSKSRSPKRRSHREGRVEQEKRGMGRSSRSRSRSSEPSRRNSRSQEPEKTIGSSDDKDEVVIVDQSTLLQYLSLSLHFYLQKLMISIRKCVYFVVVIELTFMCL